MTKPREKTREELQAEIEDGKKKIRQFENQEKMLRHFVPSRELHSLAPLMRLSLVDLPSANSIKCCSPPASLISINLEELMIKRMMMALCIFVCTFTLVACSGQQTNEPLTLGVNAIITEIDKENKIITTKDSGEEGVLGDDCLIDCSQIPMIYCNYDTQDVVDITLDDLQVGDEIILAIRSSEIENLQKEDDNKAKIAVEQLQLGTQRIK